MSEIAQEVERRISPTRSYVVGAIKRDTERQTTSPDLQSPKTLLGSRLIQTKIKTLSDFIVNNQGYTFNARNTYQVYELDNEGNPTFWGEFTPEKAKPKMESDYSLSDTTKRKKKSLEDDFKQNEPPPQPQPSSFASPYPSSFGGDSVVSTNKQVQALHDMYRAQIASTKETTDAHIQSLNKMLNEINGIRSTEVENVRSIMQLEITNLKESHRLELERFTESNNTVNFALNEKILQAELKLEEMTKEFMALQNKYFDQVKETEIAKADCESTKKDYERQYKLQAERYNFELKKLEAMKAAQDEYDKKIAKEGGLNDGNFIMDLMKSPIGQALAMKLLGMGENPVPQQTQVQPIVQARPIVDNPAQNLNGVHHAPQPVLSEPPPRPMPVQIPDEAIAHQQITQGVQL